MRSSPPILAARPRRPRSPKWPTLFSRTWSGVKPLPWSAMLRNTAPERYSRRTAIVVGPACRTALVIASWAILRRWCWVAEGRGAAVPDTEISILEAPEPAEHHREPEVDVGGGGVDAELDAQRRSPLELGPQLALGDEVDGARGQELELAVDAHGRRP